MWLSGLGSILDDLGRDTRQALRNFRKNPGFTVTAALTLGLGLGLNTAVFTIYNSVALRLLPVPDAASVVRLTRWYDRGVRSSDFTLDEYQWIHAHTASFRDSTAASVATRLTGQQRAGDAPSLVQVQFVADNYFRMLGIAPPVGRGFAAGESAPVAVLSDRFWQRQFLRRPDALGQTLLLNGQAVTVIGVAPPEFVGTGAPPTVPDAWLPIPTHAQLVPNQEFRVQVLARRAPGVSDAQLDDDMRRLEAALERQWPPDQGSRVTALTARKATFFDTDSGGYSTFTSVIQVLALAVGFVLLIGCVNLVNLMLSRSLARQREVAIRRGLGASRARIIRQLCTESALIGLVGGVAGLICSLAICRLLSNTLETRLASLGVGAEYLFLDLRPDTTVLLYALAVSIVTGVLIGLGPARRAAGVGLGAFLNQANAAGISRHRRLGNTLIAVQVTACLVLLMSAGLLWRGLRAASRVDPGFETRSTYAILLPPEVMGATPAEQAQRQQAAVRELASVPQFPSVALTLNPPMLGHLTQPFTSGDRTITSLWNAVDSGYFATLGIPVVRGRAFTPREAEHQDPVILVSENGARALWPGEDPIGKRITTPRQMFLPSLAGRSYTVIGVTRSIRGTNLSKVDASYFYLPAGDSAHLLLLRSEAGDRQTVPLIRGALARVDRSLALQAIALPLESGPVMIQRLMTEAPALLAAALGTLGLLLATIGIYGVVAFLVARRTRELGVRMALGARPLQVITLVLHQSLQPVIWGIGAGLALSAALAVLLDRMVASPELPDLLYGVDAWDPLTFVAVPTFLVAVVCLSVAPQLWRAIRVSPAVALRWE